MTDTELKELLSKYDAGVLAAYCAPAEGEREMFCPSQQWAALARQVLELRAENERLKAERQPATQCLMCKGVGKLQRISYGSSDATVERSCPACKGTGWVRDEGYWRDRAEAAEARLRGIAEIAGEPASTRWDIRFDDTAARFAHQLRRILALATETAADPFRNSDGAFGSTAPGNPIYRTSDDPNYMPDKCHADRDGDCIWVGCPQLRDGEPKKSGRHCPLDTEIPNE